MREAASTAEGLDWTERAMARADRCAQGLDRACKGKALFMPLRLALTGREHGPEMAGLLDRMGKDRAVARLSAAAKR